ncbi:hypothetical protein [Streptomyces tropicalis]|uniref:Lipoprotein n=1 Tax=Streptomyces tropicalis TaxID=3034234 RepID=A0ABT6A676_9ACTN|nr:hypothetical protein [Streptomyces tropicalis]MDF3300143.1 hypothetical protein [Streptomyces tropicalis]
MRRTLTTAGTAVLLAGLAACSSSTPSNNKPASHTTASSPTKPSQTGAAKKTSATGAPAKKLPTAQAQKEAAAVLEKEDQDFRDFLAEGIKVTGALQYTAWYQKAIVGLDMQQNAFTKADSSFTDANEPMDLLEQWRTDNSEADSRITQYAMDGTHMDAPNATTRKDAADCLAALAKADKDAEKIANGS